MQQYVALQFGEYNTEQFTYYGKARVELNSNIKTRLHSITIISLETGLNLTKPAATVEKFNSKAYTGNGRNIAKGLATGAVTYVNNRQYGAYRYYE